MGLAICSSRNKTDDKDKSKTPNVDQHSTMGHVFLLFFYSFVYISFDVEVWVRIYRIVFRVSWEQKKKDQQIFDRILRGNCEGQQEIIGGEATKE